MTKIFDELQIAKLKVWQSCGFARPFTCGSGEEKCSGVNLIPKPEGLVCPVCHRVQTHDLRHVFESAPSVYIGDGVYMDFNGHDVTLNTQREDGIHWIAVDPHMARALMRRFKELGWLEGKKFDE